MDVPFDLWGQRGGAGIDVVGEPPYAGAIRDVLGTSFQAGGSELMVTARLVPEPWNQDAVAIRVSERPVGYLPPYEAARYTPVLSRLAAAGWAPQVAARVRAVSDHRGPSASVWLDLAEPHLIAPVNRAPDGACRLLPPGAAIPVIADENLLPRTGDCWLYVTLHELVEPLPRGSRSVLQVRLDGAVIGRLTPRMSAELLPAVRRLAGNHLLTAARGLLTAGDAQPELVVYAARSHELPELWLDSIAPTVPPAGARPPSRSSAAAPAVEAAPVLPAVVAAGHGRPVGVARPGTFPAPTGTARPVGAATPLGISPPEGTSAPLAISAPDSTSTSLYGSPPDRTSASLAGSTPAPPYRPARAGTSAPVYRSQSAGEDSHRASAGPSAHWDLNDARKPAAGFERSRSAPDAIHDPPPESAELPGPPFEDGRRRLVPVPRVPGPTPRATNVQNGTGRADADRSRVSPPAPAGPATRPSEAVPPRPAGVRFAAPPGWPAPPPAWTPPADWHPNPSWPPAPADWQWWVPYWE